MDDELLTSSEVASLLRVHPKHLYRLLRQGLPGHRLGRGHWRFRRDEVLAWVGTRPSSPPRGPAEPFDPAPDVSLLEAELVPGAHVEDPPEPAGRRVVLGHVGERWVAHALGPRTSRSADGLTVAELPGDGGSRRVRASLLVPPEGLDANVLVAGCAPVLGVVLDRLERSGPGPGPGPGPGRAHWIPTHSTAALQQLARGQVHVAGIHLEDHDLGADHAALVRRQLGCPAHLVRLVRWRVGVALSPALGERTLCELLEPDLRWVVREPGAGVSGVLERALRRVGASPACLRVVRVTADHEAVARAVALGAADVGVCIEPVARAQGLGFLPLVEEGFDLVVLDEQLRRPHVARLLHDLDDPSLRREVGALGAYDASAMGHASAT